MTKSAFRLPRLGSSQLISQWLLVTIGLSIVAQLDGGWLANKLSLIPSRILLGEVWRLVTWPLIELAPVALIVTCVVIFRFGSELAGTWGDARLQRYALHVVVGAAVVTVVLSVLFDSARMVRLGGWAITDALVIAWARQFSTRPLTLYGTLTLAGRKLIQFTIGTAIVFAIYFGPIAMAPELAACAIAAMYPQGWLRR